MKGFMVGVMFALGLSLAGCAAQGAHTEGLRLMGSGEYEDGLAKLEQATQSDSSVEYRASYLSQKELATYRLLRLATDSRNAGNFQEAQALYERVRRIDPGNLRAEEGLRELERGRWHEAAFAEAKAGMSAGDIQKAQSLLARIGAENPAYPGLAKFRREVSDAIAKTELAMPVLQPKYDQPISLEFRNANVSAVLEALARSTGLNFMLDQDLRGDMKTTIFLHDAKVDDALDVLLRTNRLGKKVLDSNTVLIYPNTVEKAKDYEELLIKSFYVGNADVKQVQNSLRTLLKLQDVVVDEKLNFLIVRDTPERLRLAERIVAMHDVPEPEVMLEVEVLEVARTRLTELGVKVPNQLTLTPLSSGLSDSTLTLEDLKHLNDRKIGATIGGVVLNLRRELGDSKVLANPRIRAKNKEKAQILIGDKIPLITTTTTATGFASESIQYLDVGLKLEVQSTVYLGDEVAIKVGMEVSSLGSEVRGNSGFLAYQIGTRSASTTLQLRDGENQVLAGLISDEERTSSARVPGLGDIPVLGRLFASQKDNTNKTEIVLSITPRIVRGLSRPDAVAAEFWSGTGSSLALKPLVLGRTTTLSGRDGNSQPDKAAEPPKGLPILTMAEPKSVSLGWQSAQDVGGTGQFTVGVLLKSDGGVRSIPMQIGFDPESLQVLKVKEGGYFKRQNSESAFTYQIDQAAGKVLISPSRTGTEGARGEGSVAVLTLAPVPGGKSSTALRVLSATAITAAHQSIMPELPAPLTLNVK